MVLEAQLAVRHPGCYTEFLQGGARAVQLTAGPGMSLLSITAEDDAKLDALVARFAKVNGRPFDVVERNPGSVVLRFTICENGLVRQILATGASILWPAVHHDGLEHYTVIVQSRRALLALVETLAVRCKVEIARVVEVSPSAISAPVPFPELLADLTPKQLEILVLAVEHGYYRSPRATDAEELARRLGITRSTLTEHLRKAEAGVLSRLAAVIEDQPAVRSAASRKRGRPRKVARATK